MSWQSYENLLLLREIKKRKKRLEEENSVHKKKIKKKELTNPNKQTKKPQSNKEENKWGDQEETAKLSDAVSGSYIALMLFSGSSGISKTLVFESIVSWLVVETVFPVIR